MTTDFTHDVVVIGGAGHVGLPLAIALADRGSSVAVYDLSERAVEFGDLKTFHAFLPPFLVGFWIEVRRLKASQSPGNWLGS